MVELVVPGRGRADAARRRARVEPVGQAADGDVAAWAAALGVRVLEEGRAIPRQEVTRTGVGCAAHSFDERAKKSAESTAKLLQRAGVDFAILGPRESCTGDPARRMGNEYVFPVVRRAERSRR